MNSPLVNLLSLFLLVLIVVVVVLYLQKKKPPIPAMLQMPVAAPPASPSLRRWARISMWIFGAIFVPLDLLWLPFAAIGQLFRDAPHVSLESELFLDLPFILTGIFIAALVFHVSKNYYLSMVLGLIGLFLTFCSIWYYAPEFGIFLSA